jgi:hypothetical protein
MADFNAGRFASPDADKPHIDLTSLPLPARVAVLEAAAPGTRVALLGYRLTVSGRHLKPSALAAWRGVGDPDADAAVAALRAARAGAAGAGAGGAGGGGGCPYSAAAASVDALGALAAGGDAAAARFLASASTPPAWVDWARVDAGVAFFRANAGLIGVALLNLSLLGGFGAPDINETLLRAGGLAGARDTANRRLMETLQFVLDVAATPGGLAPGGPGWRACINVRLLHAGVRARAAAAGGARAPGGARHPPWDAAAWGVPVNQEDTVVTQLAFSLVVLMGLERAGLAWHMGTAGMEAYLHLWRLVGAYCGVHPDLSARTATLSDAQVLLESTVSHLVHGPAPSTRALVLATLRAVAFRAPLAWSPRTHAAVTRVLAGRVYADAMGIPAMDDPALDARIDDATPTTALPGELHVPQVAVPPGWAAATPPGGVAVRTARLLLWVTAYAVKCVAVVVRAVTGGGGGGGGGAAAVTDGAAADADVLGAAALAPFRVLPYILAVPGAGAVLGHLQVAQLRRMLAARLGGRTEFRLRV